MEPQNTSALNPILDVLNDNQGAALVLLTTAIVVLTFIYVTATIWIVWETRRSNRLVLASNELSQNALEQSAEFERERSRPSVLFNIEYREEFNSFYATLRNFGRTPAYELNIAIDPPLVRKKGSDRSVSIVTKPPMFLAPGQLIDDFLDTGWHWFESGSTQVFHVSLGYRDLTGHAYSESMVIDLSFHEGRTRLSGTDHTKEISSTLKRVESTIKNVASGLQELVAIQDRACQQLPAATGTASSLTETDVDYLMRMGRTREGRIYVGEILRSSPKTETAFESIQRLVALGHARFERDFVTPTLKGWACIDEIKSKTTEATTVADAVLPSDGAKN